MPFAKRVAELTPSITLAVTAKAKALKAAGHDVVAFGAGEPDFDTPEHIKEAAIKAMRDGMTRYLPAAGLPALREAVAETYTNKYGLPMSAKNTVITVGGKHALYNIFQILLDPGDEVIIPAPYWVSYPEMVRLASGEPVIIETDESTGFRMTVEQLRGAINYRTKAVVINSPSNPTGAAYTRKQLQALAEIAAEKKLTIISDEIYEDLVYGRFKFTSTPTLSPDIAAHTLVVSGAAKTYAMTGWRIGWVIGPEKEIEMLGRLQSQQTSNATSFAQAGAVAALTGPQDCVKEMKAAFLKRRDYILDRLCGIPDVPCPTPDGAFYVFPNVSAYYGKKAGGKKIDGSLAMCDYLLDSVQVAAVPGIGFGNDNNIRLSYATSLELIQEGMDRIEKALAKLK
jgi:aspartate aminotransferase